MQLVRIPAVSCDLADTTFLHDCILCTNLTACLAMWRPRFHCRVQVFLEHTPCHRESSAPVLSQDMYCRISPCLRRRRLSQSSIKLGVWCCLLFFWKMNKWFIIAVASAKGVFDRGSWARPIKWFRIRSCFLKWILPLTCFCQVMW